MKVQQAKSKAAIKGNGVCRHCGHVIKSGQYYAAAQMPNNPYIDRWFTLHVKCMRVLVADVPDDVDRNEENFNRIKEKIAAEGTIFYDLTN